MPLYSQWCFKASPGRRWLPAEAPSRWQAPGVVGVWRVFLLECPRRSVECVVWGGVHGVQGLATVVRIAIESCFVFQISDLVCSATLGGQLRSFCARGLQSNIIPRVDMNYIRTLIWRLRVCSTGFQSMTSVRKNSLRRPVDFSDTPRDHQLSSDRRFLAFLLFAADPSPRPGRACVFLLRWFRISES